MKKTLSILVIAMLVLILCIGNVSAKQPNLKVALSVEDGKTTVAPGETVTIIASYKDVAANEPGLSAMTGAITYDKTVFEPLTSASFAGQSGWASIIYNDMNGIFSGTCLPAKAEDHDFVKITFKVKTNATAGQTEIKLQGVEPSDGLEEFQPAAQSIKVTIGAPEPTPTPTPEATPTPATTPTPTTAPSAKPTQMPNTGIEGIEALQMYALPIIAAVAVIGIFAYVKYNKMDK